MIVSREEEKQQEERRVGSHVYANLCILDRTTPTWLRKCSDASKSYRLARRGSRTLDPYEMHR